MNLKECAGCGRMLTTRTIKKLGRNDSGLWIECKSCTSSTVFLDKKVKATMEAIKTVSKLMEDHDWFYDFSDSNRDYLTGLSERAEIRRNLLLLPEGIQEELIEMYCPPSLRDEFRNYFAKWKVEYLKDPKNVLKLF